jgi:hypothetical protein
LGEDDDGKSTNKVLFVEDLDDFFVTDAIFGLEFDD